MRPSFLAVLPLLLPALLFADTGAAISLFERGSEARNQLKFDLARDFLEQAHELVSERPGKLRAQVRHALGTVYWKLDLPDQAEDMLYDASVETGEIEGTHDPLYLMHLNNLAYFYIQQGRAAEGLPSIRYVIETIESDPKKYAQDGGCAYYDTYAVALEKTGAVTEAHQVFKKALALVESDDVITPYMRLQRADIWKNYAAFLERQHLDPALAADLRVKVKASETMAKGAVAN